MQVALESILSDAQLDLSQTDRQRQISIVVAAVPEVEDTTKLPLNLCLILDRSGSMKGAPLETVKQAAQQLIRNLQPDDRISVVAFDHQAQIVVPNQTCSDPDGIIAQIDGLSAGGGTAIDIGIKMGIEQMLAWRGEAVSQAFILTDGENEHGDNPRCIKLAEFATQNKITLNTLGFGEFWNQNTLEKIADVALGTLAYIERPEQAISEFDRIFNRMQAVGLTNAYLEIDLAPKVRLAELKPVAQVAPDTIELPVESTNHHHVIRLGDLMKDVSRAILINTYVGELPEGEQQIATIRVRYDDPANRAANLTTPPASIKATVTRNWQPQVDRTVQQHTLTLAKYRQTQLAEQKLQAGDRSGAATLLQSAAQTALQMGDTNAATVLQSSATSLQQGQELSEADKKKTRMVSKTILQ
jgi:Ca-activated chloride channel homolog